MYYFIVNPHSRSGHAFDVWKLAEAYLKEENAEFKAYFTKAPGHARDLARQIAGLSLPLTLGVLGGDGTLNEVVNGLLETQGALSRITLGYIPSGSGNDFARGLGISADPREGIRSILSPREYVTTDLGLAKTPQTSRFFLVSSGIGYDADICRKAATSSFKKFLNRIRLGKLSYALVALKLLLLYRPCPVSIRLDKKERFDFPKFYFLASMNMKYEGGGVKFCPQASSEDSLLDVCLAGKLSKWKILALFPTAFFGKHVNFQGIHMYRAKRIDIISPLPLPVHCDGESLGTARRLTVMDAGKKVTVILR